MVSVDEYLSTNYEPNCDYVDGVLYQKPWPTWDHGRLQGRVGQLVNAAFPNFVAACEVTVKIRNGKYLVPDLIIERRGRMHDPYPTAPVHLCVEILSIDEKMSAVLAKCEEYHAWGVATTWVLDPEAKRAWEYRRGQHPIEVPKTGSLTAEGISISLSDIFSVF